MLNIINSHTGLLKILATKTSVYVQYRQKIVFLKFLNSKLVESLNAEPVPAKGWLSAPIMCYSNPWGRSRDNTGSGFVRSNSVNRLLSCRNVSTRAKHARQSMEDVTVLGKAALWTCILPRPVTNGWGKKTQIIFSLGNPFPWGWKTNPPPPHTGLRILRHRWASQDWESRVKLPNSNRRTQGPDAWHAGKVCNAILLRAGRTIFTEFSSVKWGIARIRKHGPKIRSQMFQFSWKLFLEMKKTKH